MNETSSPGTAGHARRTGDANSYRMTLRRLRGPLALVAFFSALINILMLTGPLYMLQVYDRVLGSGSVTTLAGLFTIVVVLYAFMGVYEFLRARILARAALRLDRELGPTLFAAWLRSGRRGEAKAGTGAAQPLQDLDALRGFLSGPTMGSLFDLPWIPLYLALLFLVHPWLGWLTLAGAGIVAVAALLNRRLTRTPQEAAVRLESEARLFADQGRRSAELVGAMGMEGPVTRRWREGHGRALAAGQRASNISEVASAFSKSFRMLLQSAMLTTGALLVLRQEMSGGMIIAGSILSGRALAPIDQIIAQWRLVGNAAIAHRRLTAFFASRPAGGARVDLPAPTGAIDATRLTCLAPAAPGVEPARMLNDVSFSLAPGEGLGVIGNSAAGKSTLARLIVGAWTPERGEIRFDGATRAQWDPEVLGRSTGYLPQVVELLPGTIRDNITRFDPRARDEDMIEAARLAGMHEAILALPDGYGTRVGLPDQPLSGGQIQRIGLVRAIFGRPRIVVLDEPNSNLDAAGEAALARVIRSLRAAGSTVILMTHRTSALAEVNKLMLLANGGVVAFGERDDVLRGMMLRPVPDSAAPDSTAATAGGAGQAEPPPAAGQAGGPVGTLAGTLAGSRPGTGSMNGARPGGPLPDSFPGIRSRRPGRFGHPAQHAAPHPGAGGIPLPEEARTGTAAALPATRLSPLSGESPSGMPGGARIGGLDGDPA